MKDIVDISIKEINEINDVLNNAGLNNLVNELNNLNSLLSSEEKSIIELKQLANNGTVEELNKKIDAVIKSND